MAATAALAIAIACEIVVSRSWLSQLPEEEPAGMLKSLPAVPPRRALDDVAAAADVVRSANEEYANRDEQRSRCVMDEVVHPR